MVRHQRRIKGEVRSGVKGYIDRRIEECIAVAQEDYQCSRSFIIRVGMAEFFGIKGGERYDDGEGRKRRKAHKRKGGKR